MRTILILSVIWLIAVSAPAAEPLTHDGWQTFAYRDEIQPEFAVNPAGGPDGAGGLVIYLGEEEGLDGAWRKSFPVTGGKHYRLTAHRKTSSVPLLWRHTFVELLFTDDRGRKVKDETVDLLSQPFYLPEPARTDAVWTKLSDTFRAPRAATRAMVELRLRWAPGGSAEYGAVRLQETEPPAKRLARLAAVHYIPRGGESSMDNCRQFAPYIEEAARQRADLVVLGESITYAGRKTTYEEAAEPIPGPSTDYFVTLAKQHDLYIVVGLYERAGHLIYNTSALVGPEGYIGKYRKVAPARSEMRKGIMPGAEYPVFDTRFGKVGMMICFDNFMPEVARNLALNGAEVIALPIWGGDPAQARANASFNQVYLVSSTYTDDKTWMRTGVWDKEGRLAVEANDWGEVVVHEVDLNHRHLRRANLGDFRGRIKVQRPLNPVER